VVRWPLQPLQSFQKTQLQPPFDPSVGSPCHPWFTASNLSHRSPIFETSATALWGTTGSHFTLTHGHYWIIQPPNIWVWYLKIMGNHLKSSASGFRQSFSSLPLTHPPTYFSSLIPLASKLPGYLATQLPSYPLTDPPLPWDIHPRIPGISIICSVSLLALLLAFCLSRLLLTRPCRFVFTFRNLGKR
jgi:hypothetical protein